MKKHIERKAKGRNRKYIGLTYCRFKNSNTKLGKSIYCFDLLPGEACPNCNTCFNTCYAKNNVTMRPTVAQWQAENTWLAKYHLGLLEVMLFDTMKALTEKGKINVVRPHSNGGDFFSQDYVDLWEAIAKAFPQVTFYCYTKAENNVNLEALEALPNFTIIYSLINGKYLNYGKVNYLQSLEAKQGAFICPCGYVKGLDTKGICGKCKYCFTSKSPKPCFKIHR